MSDDNRLADLVSLWEHHLSEGRDVPASELCGEQTVLVPALERRIELMRWMGRLVAEKSSPTPPQGGAAGQALTTPESTLRMEAPDGAVSLAPLMAGDAPEGYEVLGELGRGGMGVVYKARQLALDRVTAVKMILSGARAHPTELRLLHDEARAIACFTHPNIVQIYEVGEHNGLPFLALEFCAGDGLDTKLRRGPLPAREAAELVEVVARAVQAAHQKGIVHRDLKPSNVLLTEEGTPKISDFGLAQRLGADVPAAGGAIMGTPPYMAPEQVVGDRGRIGPLTDVYALGAVLYECLTGRPPFRGPTVSDTLLLVVHNEAVSPRLLQPQVPRDLETVCLKCLQKDPAKRYSSALALAEDLRRFLRGEPVRARRQSTWERGWSWAKRNPRVAGLSGAVLLLLVTVAVVSTAAAFSIADAKRRAEDNARKARAAVDQMLTEAAEEGLADVPQMDPARRRLLEKALAFYEDFSKEKPADPALRQELGRAHRRVGNISKMLGRTEQAEHAYREAIALFGKLTADFPAAADYRHDLAVTHNDLGELLRITGRPEAEASYRSALDLQERLVQDFPREPPSYRQELARTHNNRGILLKDAGRKAEAAEDHDRGMALLRQLRDEFPGEPAYRVDLARVCTNHGILLRHRDRPREAEEAYTEAITLLKELVPPRESRAARDHRYKLANALVNLGTLLADQPGRRADAETALRQALGLLEKLVLQFPEYHIYRRDLANGHNSLGYVLEDDGKPREAEEAYRQALRLFRELVQDFPGVAEYESLTAMTLNNLGWQLLGREETATGELLVLTVPDCWGAPGGLGLALAEVGWRLRNREQLAEACRLFEQAIERQQAALQPEPANPVYRQRLGDHHRNLARAAVRLGDHVRAAAAAEDLHRLAPDHAADCYHAGRFLARCAALAEKEAGPSGFSRPARSYGDRAVRLLREAAEKGHANAGDLNNNADFDALRRRDDFRDLLRELEAKPKKAL